MAEGSCVCVCAHPKGWALSGMWVFTSLLAKEVETRSR